MTDTRATRREWTGLAVLALPTLLLSVDVSVLYLALPSLSADLGADGTQQLWVLDIYSFLLAGFLVTMGSLGDRIGRRRLLLIGAVAFAICSVVAAYSTSVEMLIAARALLGVAGATLMPSTMALIRNMFHDPKQMAFAFSVWFSCFLGGMTVGPLVGGLLLERYWWGSAFLLGVPCMALLLVLGPLYLPEYRDPAAGRLDLASAALSLAAILPTIYGLKEVARSGVATGPVLAIGLGAAFGVAFVRRQRRLADPLLDLRLLANRRLGTALSVFLLTGVVMAGVSLMMALYLQSVLGLSPLRAGLWLVPSNLAMVAGLMLAPVLHRRITAARLMAFGLAAGAIGLALLAVVPVDRALPAVAALCLVSVGLGFPMALINNMIMVSAPPERAGSAASLTETSGEFGIAVGVATLGTLGGAVYRYALPGEVSTGVPPDAVTAAGEGITAAVAVAARLPSALGTELLEGARAAFTSGLGAVGLVGGLVFFVAAIASAIVLRDPAPAAPSTTDDAPPVTALAGSASVES
jgi:DHA2 family multidrug resistance protein-like MFS transporter